MKAKLLTFLSIVWCTATFAQKEITVDEAARPMSKGSFPSFSVEIPQAKLKDVDKAWKKYLSAGSKGKLVEATEEINMPGAVNKNVSAEPFNVYSKLLETSEGVKLTAWLSLGANDSVYISKDLSNDKDIAAQKYVRDFAIQEYRVAVNDELDIEKDKQKKLEGELKDLIKEEDKATKNINNKQRSISKAKSDILTNEGDQKRKADLIYTQKGVLEASKSSEALYKEAEKVLKGLENEKKKLEKENDKLHKDIDGWEKEIRDEERNIDASKGNQKVKIEQVERQKQAVSAVEDKLKNIK